MPRRVATGFELTNLGYGAGSSLGDCSSEAARTGRYGYAYRKASNRQTTFHVDGQYGSGGNSQQGFCWGWSVWFRIRTWGTGEDQIAAVQGLGNSPSTCVITIDSVGKQLNLYSVGGDLWAGRTLIWPVGTPPIGVILATSNWYQLGWAYRHADPGCLSVGPPCLPPACEGSYTFFLNDATGVRLTTLDRGTFGLSTNGMGNDFGSSGNPRNLGYTAVVLGHEALTGMAAQSGLELDYDDLILQEFTGATGYVSCQVPPYGPPNPYTPNDVSVDRGHYRVDPTSVAGGVGFGLTDVRQVPLPPTRQSANQEILSSVSGAQAQLVTPTPNALGYLGLIEGLGVGASFRQASAANPQQFEVQSTTVANRQRPRAEANGAIECLQFPVPGDSVVAWPDADTYTFGIQKSADASATRIATLALEVESPTVVLSPAFAVGSPDGSCITATGEYTGNGTFQTIALGFRPDWIFIAPVGTGLPGVIWHDAMLAPHGWTAQANLADRLRVEPTGFTVMGTANEVNSNGTTYRAVAIWDQRKLRLFRGAVAFLTGEAGPRTVQGMTPFTTDPSFVPAALWCQIEQYDATSTNGGYYKGPGHTGSNASPLTATQVTNAIPSAIGAAFTVGAALTNLPQTAWTGWATTNFTSTILWAVASYTGNGAGSQTVALALGGQAPGWVLVVPHNGQSYLRHLSHTGAHSCDIGGGDTSLGITALAVNQITVGSALNANGIGYDVLAVVAGTNGGGGGGLPPGWTGSTDPVPPPTPGTYGCVDTFASGSDSGGGTGCADSLSSGSDSGGGSGCPAPSF